MVSYPLDQGKSRKGKTLRRITPLIGFLVYINGTYHHANDNLEWLKIFLYAKQQCSVGLGKLPNGGPTRPKSPFGCL